MEKVVFKTGLFIDFEGNVREVIFCAISADGADSLTKVLKLGLSVRNVKDSYDEELGKKIAYGKAKKDKTCIGKLYSTNKGMINAKMVEALLEQELYYFKNNPGKYLKGYDAQKDKFKLKK